MNTRTKAAASSTNQGAGNTAGDLNIPTLSSLGATTLEAFTAAAPVIQDGEDAQTLTAAQKEAMATMGNPPFGVKVADTTAPAGAPLSSPDTLAALQVTVDAASRRAANNPVAPRYFERNEMHTPNIPPEQVEIPISGNLDEKLKRPDLDIEPVDAPTFSDRAAMEAFMREFVVVRIHASAVPGDENPVPLSVNGRQIFVWREEDTAVRRMYAEQLMRAKPVQIRTEQQRTPAGDIRNLVHKTASLRYPFQIVRDDNPRGRAWASKIMSEK